jgi:Fur family ferric uptake transcriptional regulator
MLSYLETSHELLQKRGYRLTPQRYMILQVLQEADGHLSIDQILMGVKKSYPHMNLSTIYRTLELFRDVGLVREIHLPGEALQYEVNEERSHQHLLCRGCRTLIHLDHDLLGNLDEQIAQQYHFYGETLDLLVVGYCEKCWNKAYDKSEETAEKGKRGV